VYDSIRAAAQGHSGAFSNIVDYDDLFSIYGYDVTVCI